MRQRVMIAMAVACDPKVLVADEPTTALDVTVQAGILDVLRGPARPARHGIVLITHDLGVVADIADRVVVMYAGRVVERAGVDDLFARPQHHYTAGLLGGRRRTPGRHAGTHRLQEIPGLVPVLSSSPTRAPSPTGARRPTRPCRTARRRWSRTRPDRRDDHGSACWHPRGHGTDRQEA